MRICWEEVSSKYMWMCFHYLLEFIYLSNKTRTRLVRIFESRGQFSQTGFIVTAK